MEIKKISPKELETMRQRGKEIVSGKFIFHEVPGGVMDFTVKFFKGDSPKNYSLRDGHSYEIPLNVAEHLNENCYYPVHAYATDEDGKPIAKINEKIRRCSFQSFHFTPIKKDIITVERV